VRIRVNGEAKDVRDAITVDALVTELGLNRATIAVELNREVVRRAVYPERSLAPGDEVEIVTLVGGG
jgi:thiamine biosynthesis protein ThiS